MNGNCNTCPAEAECGYEYKPCDCCDQRKFKPKMVTPYISQEQFDRAFPDVLSDVQLVGQQL